MVCIERWHETDTGMYVYKFQHALLVLCALVLEPNIAKRISSSLLEVVHIHRVLRRAHHDGPVVVVVVEADTVHHNLPDQLSRVSTQSAPVYSTKRLA